MLKIGLIFCQFNFFSYLCDMERKLNITFEEIWEITKKNFKIGKDYIESETEDYIVFCPFNYTLLSYFHDVFRGKGCYFHFSHCLCQGLGPFVYWYNGLYQDGRLKAFFVRKDIDLSLMWSEQEDALVEFTGWIDFNDRNFLHFAHDVKNELITGEYRNYQADFAYNRKVARKRKKDADFVNKIASEVYDDLFVQYDIHINSLEETLFNIIGNFSSTTPP